MLPSPRASIHGNQKGNFQNQLWYGFSRILRCIALYSIVYCLNWAQTPSLIYLFLILFTASCILLPLQRPWNQKKKPISQSQWTQIAVYGGANAFSLYCLIAGTRVCGPATVLLIECFEIFIPYFMQMKTMSQFGVGKRTTSQIRIIAIVLIGYLILWLSHTESPSNHKYNDSNLVAARNIKSISEQNFDAPQFETKKSAQLEVDNDNDEDEDEDEDNNNNNNNEDDDDNDNDNEDEDDNNNEDDEDDNNEEREEIGEKQQQKQRKQEEEEEEEEEGEEGEEGEGEGEEKEKEKEKEKENDNNNLRSIPSPLEHEKNTQKNEQKNEQELVEENEVIPNLIHARDIIVNENINENENNSNDLFEMTIAMFYLFAHVAITDSLKERSRDFAQKIGGLKRLYALTIPSGLAIVTIPAFISHFNTFEGYSFGLIFTGVGFFSIFFSSFIILVLSFYVDCIYLQSLSNLSKVQFGLLLPAGFSLGIEIWLNGVSDTALVIVSYLCIIFGSSLLFSMFDSNDSNDSTFHEAHVSYYLVYFGSPSIKAFKLFITSVFKGQDTRRIFLFLCLNLTFTFVEALYGYLTNSLSLISDASHMLFDCTALFIGLYAAYMSKWRPNLIFSYGYGRFEVLSGFVNGVFLVVIAFMVLVESLERLVDPPKIDTTRLLLVSSGGFLVNMVGIIFFHEHHSHGALQSGECAMGGHGHSHGDGHSHSVNHNMHGIFLHILADTLGSIGVIVSSLLIEYWGLYISDPICSLIISCLIFLSVLPLLQSSAQILLQRTPEHLEHKFADCVNEIKRVEGVNEVNRSHFWTYVNDEVVGTVNVQIAPSINPQVTLRTISSILTSYGIRKPVVQINKAQAK